MKIAGVQIDQQAIISNLKYEKLGNNGNAVAYFDFQPTDSRYDFMKGPLPLLIYDGQTKSWRMPGYKDFSQNNISIGSAIDVWTGQFNNPEYLNTFLRMYNIGVPDAGFSPQIGYDFMNGLDNAPQVLTPEQIIQNYNWNESDKVVQFLSSNNIPIRLQHLLDFGTIDNVRPQIKNLNNADLIKFLDLHIKAIIERYPQATEISVVNESFLAWNDAWKQLSIFEVRRKLYSSSI